MNEIQTLYRRARVRQDAAAVIDSAHATFLGQLGAIDRMVESTALSPAGAVVERARLMEQHTTMLRTIAGADEKQLHALLFPHKPTPAASRAEKAMQMVAQARAAGVVLTSPAAGVVEAAPREKLTGPLRSMVADLRAEISAHLRAGIETFAPAT